MSEQDGFRVGIACHDGSCVAVDMNPGIVRVTRMVGGVVEAGAPIVEYDEGEWAAFGQSIRDGDFLTPEEQEESDYQAEVAARDRELERQLGGSAAVHALMF